MTMKELLDEALENIYPQHHEFLIRYRKGSQLIYGFTEGKEDLCFYRSAIESVLPDGWGCELWHSGKKQNVLNIYGLFNWSQFNKEQILFFVDKDLSVFLGSQEQSEVNVYVTDRYSIENHIVSRTTCDRMLVEVLNLHILPKDDKDGLLNLFEKQLEIFQDKMSEVMVWIIHWMLKSQQPCLDNIIMNHLFYFSKGELLTRDRFQGHGTISEYIHARCRISFEDVDLLGLKEKFDEAEGSKNFIRGKYILWFFVEFLINIFNEIQSIFPALLSKPKSNVSLAHANAIALIATRFRTPTSLKIFLSNTSLRYIDSMSVDSCAAEI